MKKLSFVAKKSCDKNATEHASTQLARQWNKAPSGWFAHKTVQMKNKPHSWDKTSMQGMRSKQHMMKVGMHCQWCQSLDG